MAQLGFYIKLSPYNALKIELSMLVVFHLTALNFQFNFKESEGLVTPCPPLFKTWV